MFTKLQRRKYEEDSSALLQCMQCIAEAQKEVHQCEACLETIDDRHFEKHIQQNAGQEESSRLLCEACKAMQGWIQCCKCNDYYEAKHWTYWERCMYRKDQERVCCKACRAQGYHPRRLESYTCQTCAHKFGSTMFNSVHIYQYKKQMKEERAHPRELQCRRCKPEAQQVTSRRHMASKTWRTAGKRKRTKFGRTPNSK